MSCVFRLSCENQPAKRVTGHLLARADVFVLWREVEALAFLFLFCNKLCYIVALILAGICNKSKHKCDKNMKRRTRCVNFT